MCNITIYYCNIHIKYLQHTSETSEILETYFCNMHFFLLWCLRLPTGDDVPVDDYLPLVAPGWWWRGVAVAATASTEWGAVVDGCNGLACECDTVQDGACSEGWPWRRGGVGRLDGPRQTSTEWGDIFEREMEKT